MSRLMGAAGLPRDASTRTIDARSKCDGRYGDSAQYQRDNLHTSLKLCSFRVHNHSPMTLVDKAKDYLANHHGLGQDFT